MVAPSTTAGVTAQPMVTAPGVAPVQPNTTSGVAP
jgi:hypothetical protein